MTRQNIQRGKRYNLCKIFSSQLLWADWKNHRKSLVGGSLIVLHKKQKMIDQQSLYIHKEKPSARDTNAKQVWTSEQSCEYIIAAPL